MFIFRTGPFNDVMLLGACSSFVIKKGFETIKIQSVRILYLCYNYIKIITNDIRIN